MGTVGHTAGPLPLSNRTHPFTRLGLDPEESWPGLPVPHPPPQHCSDEDVNSSPIPPGLCALRCGGIAAGESTHADTHRHTLTTHTHTASNAHTPRHSHTQIHRHTLFQSVNLHPHALTHTHTYSPSKSAHPGCFFQCPQSSRL